MNSSAFAFPVRPQFEAKLPHELPDGSPAIFVFTQDFTFNSPLFGPGVIEKGFETDFASIPPWCLGWLNSDDPRIQCPSCVHDKRYNDRNCTRKQADQEIMVNMILCGARPTMAFAVFLALRLVGWTHWSKIA